MSRILRLPSSLKLPPRSDLEIDWSNPITKHISKVLPLNGSTLELINRRPLTLIKTDAFSDGIRGKALQGSDTEACGYFPQLDLDGTNKVTVSCWFWWDSYSNNDDMLMEFTYNLNTVVGGFYINPNSSAPAAGEFAFALKTTAGNTCCVSIPRTVVPEKQWHHLLLAIDGSTTTALDCLVPYVNGVKQAATVRLTAGGTLVDFPAQSLYLFNRGGASLFGNGRMQHLIIRRGYLAGEVEARAEYENPYGIYKQRAPQIYVRAAPAPLVRDTFTEGSTVTLQSHTPESGGAWVKHPNFATDGNVESTYFSGGSTGATSIYYNNAEPLTADYFVEAAMDCKTTSTPQHGLLGRVDSAASTFYQLFWNGAGWRLESFVAGTGTEIGFYASSITPGTPNTLRLSMQGTTIKAFVDGVERISVTDATITAKGYAGVRSRLNGKIDNLIARPEVGVITDVKVRPDGWSCDVAIEGFTEGATYDFGSLDDMPATTTNPKFTMTVTSEGYNASGVLGTVVRTIYGTHVVRKPYPLNAQKDDDTFTAPGRLVVRVALSECVYNDDKNGGAGTSGTDPTVTIAAGWATNTGGSSETSTAVTAMSVTNNSTLDYPKVIAQWDWGLTPAYKRVEADFSIGCHAFHGHGIACVTLSAVGNTSLHSQSSTVTAVTKRQTASDLYCEGYHLSVPIAGYTQGEDITLRYIGYPVVGDADSILDTESETSIAHVIRGLTRLTATCDKTGALKVFGVVSTTGSDTTGATNSVLATAATTPFLTIGKALASGATVIYCRAGTHDILGSEPSSVSALSYYREVRAYPSESPTLNRGGSVRAFKASKLAYIGLPITYSTGNGWLQGITGTTLLQFHTCEFTCTNVTHLVVGLGYESSGTWFIDSKLHKNDDFGVFSNSCVSYALHGCYSDDGAGGALNSGDGMVGVYGAVANRVHANNTAATAYVASRSNAGASNQVPDNFIFCWNKFTGGLMDGGNSVGLDTGNTDPRRHLAVIGNSIEVQSETASGPAMWIGADGSLLDHENIIVAHNTVTGQRCNLFYNDTGTSANVCRNIFVRNNAFRSYEIKDDTFGTPSGLRVGNWAALNGVNHSDNRYDGSFGFTHDYDGINVMYVTAADGTYGQLGYKADKSKDGDGTGGGNYVPSAGSVLRKYTLRQKYITYDMNGNAI